MRNSPLKSAVGLGFQSHAAVADGFLSLSTVHNAIVKTGVGNGGGIAIMQVLGIEEFRAVARSNRGRGEIRIYQRASDGRWAARVTVLFPAYLACHNFPTDI